MFRGLDLELVPGRPVALAGPNGSGKTLAVYTLLRFADLAAGTLSIDGTDARDLPPERIRALLAWSPEQPILFPASLRATLRLGAAQATDREMTELLGRFGLAPWLEHARDRSVLWVTHRPAELALFPDVRHLRGGMT